MVLKSALCAIFTRGDRSAAADVASRAERALSFGAVAGDYDRLRPGPPAAAVNWLLPGRAGVVVDLAAGTGLLSRALTARAARVIAVEPDQRMAAVLRARSPLVTVLEGRGEAIGLPDASADGVFISSAWHWLDPARALPEIARVLRDGGRFGAIWTGRDRRVGWVREADLAVRRAVLSSREDGPDRSDSRDAGPESRSERLFGPRQREIELPQDAPFGPPATASFEFSRTMTIDDMVGMLATYSGVITASPRDRAAGLDRARAVLAGQFGTAGTAEVPMRSWCWRADRLPR
jgi:SAM-dependent methyltransferase